MSAERLRKVLSLAMMLTAAVSAAVSAADELKLAVAANFTDATRDIIPLFEKASGHSIKASFGSTGKLYAQIENGAPFEIFLAADARTPKKAEEQGLAVSGTRFTYARGRLVMWSAKSGLFSNGEAYLKAGGFEHLAIANPETAPYGLAAEQVMEHLDLWSGLQSKLVKGESIAQAFQFVATGNAEAGFLALSQVKAWKGGAGSLWEIPQADYAPIDQQAVLLKKGQPSEAARAFLAFLKGPQARAVITGYGYGVE
jgi:molybdate transport system substrate-binding protein